ncbi:MAG TPA: ATP-binding cassette domain-containing protein [Spirochaetia bacterium]|nr:ATP-binding cassette domain-containing protein [Spirochaetia bacterium]
MKTTPPAPDTPVIDFSQVRYSPGAAPLFDGLSLRIPPKACTVVMGASGAGKSTLLRLGAGLIPADEGKIAFQARDWSELSDHENAVVREDLGFAFQNGALWANASVYRNVELPYLYHRPKADRQEVRDAVTRAARMAGISGQLGQMPSQLSLGEKKLVSLARALVMDPQVILLDDPTGGLDPQATESLVQLFSDLKRQGRTLVVVTQEPQVTARIADRLVLLKTGQVLAEGTFAEVTRLTDPAVTAILTSVLSQAATFSGDILDLLSIDQDDGKALK